MNILRTEHNFCTKQKKIQPVPPMTHLVKLSFCSGGKLGILISVSSCIPTSKNWFNNKLASWNWKNIYALPCKVMLDTHTHLFQNKIWNNILYIKKSEFFYLGESTTYLYSFCKFPEENANYVFSVCHHAKVL